MALSHFNGSHHWLSIYSFKGGQDLYFYATNFPTFQRLQHKLILLAFIVQQPAGNISLRLKRSKS